MLEAQDKRVYPHPRPDQKYVTIVPEVTIRPKEESAAGRLRYLPGLCFEKTLLDAVHNNLSMRLDRSRRLDDYMISTSTRCLDKQNSDPFSQQLDS
jgi:hypothetical protein